MEILEMSWLHKVPDPGGNIGSLLDSQDCRAVLKEEPLELTELP